MIRLILLLAVLIAITTIVLATWWSWKRYEHQALRQQDAPLGLEEAKSAYIAGKLDHEEYALVIERTLKEERNDDN